MTRKNRCVSILNEAWDSLDELAEYNQTSKSKMIERLATDELKRMYLKKFIDSVQGHKHFTEEQANYLDKVSELMKYGR